MKKKAVSLFLMVSIVMSLVGCGSQNGESSSASEGDAEKVYTISCDQAFAPFAIQNDDGSYTGIDVELLAAIADAGGFEYELKPMDFSGIIPALVSGTIDGAMACMNITDERKESVDFSDPYYSSGVALVCREDEDITSYDDLKGLTVAGKEGSIGAQWCEDNADKYGYTAVTYPDSVSMAMAVTDGQADCLLEDYPTISYQIKIGEHDGLKVAMDAVDGVGAPGDVGFAVKKGTNADLLEKFNKGLAAIKENGTYDEIIAEYE